MTLENGLRVVAVRVPSVPLVELRLRIPLPGDSAHSPAAQVLCRTLLHRRVHAFPDAVVSTAHDATGLTVSGSLAASALPGVLEAVTASLTSPQYDATACAAAGARLAARNALVRARPSVIAREHLLGHVYGGAFRSCVAGEADIASVTCEQLARMHAEVIRPEGSVLVLVGDLAPEKTRHELPPGLSEWSVPSTPRSRATGGARPPAFTGVGVVHVRRRGAEQSQIMLAAPAPAQTDSRFGALSLAIPDIGIAG